MHTISTESLEMYDLPASSQMGAVMKLVNNCTFLLELLVCKAVTMRIWLIALGK